MNNFQKIIEGMGCQLSIDWHDNYNADLRQARWVHALDDAVIDVFVRGNSVTISVHKLSEWRSPHDLLTPPFADKLFARLETAGLRFKAKQAVMR
jgi:hypothetical protein